jgi:hypothetical protein
MYKNLQYDSTGTILSLADSYYKSSVRYGLDNSSNPDPNNGGLIIISGSPQFKLPLLTSNPGLGIMQPYVDDPAGDFTLLNDEITFNFNGYIRISIEYAVLSSNVNEDKVFQILPVGATILNSINMVTAAGSNSLTIGGLLPQAYSEASSNQCVVSIGDSIELAVLLNNVGNDSITLNTNVSIQRL